MNSSNRIRLFGLTNPKKKTLYTRNKQTYRDTLTPNHHIHIQHITTIYILKFTPPKNQHEKKKKQLLKCITKFLIYSLKMGFSLFAPFYTFWQKENQANLKPKA